MQYALAHLVGAFIASPWVAQMLVTVYLFRRIWRTPRMRLSNFHYIGIGAVIFSVLSLSYHLGSGLISPINVSSGVLLYALIYQITKLVKEIVRAVKGEPYV